METVHFICQQWFGVEKEEGKVNLSRWFDNEPSVSTLFIAYRSTVFWLWPVHLNANSSHLFCLNMPIVIWPMIIFGMRSLLVQGPIDSPVFNDVHRVSFFSFSRYFWTSCIAISPLRVKWTMTQATPSLSDLSKSHLNRSVHLSFSSPHSLSLLRWRKIVIGIIVELLAFLPSLLIVQLFRRVRPRSQPNSSCSSSMTLPWWSLFLIYGLCLILMILSIFFIVALGIEFGDFKAQQWLTSILSGLFSSILLTQPLKVFFHLTKKLNNFIFRIGFILDPFRLVLLLRCQEWERTSRLPSSWQRISSSNSRSCFSRQRWESFAKRRSSSSV